MHDTYLLDDAETHEAQVKAGSISGRSVEDVAHLRKLKCGEGL